MKCTFNGFLWILTYIFFTYIFLIVILDGYGMIGFFNEDYSDISNISIYSIPFWI